MFRFREAFQLVQENRHLQKLGSELNSPIPKVSADGNLGGHLTHPKWTSLENIKQLFFDLFWKKMINTVKQVVWIVSDERMFLSPMILLFFGCLSSLLLLKPVWHRWLKKGNCSLEWDSLFKLFEGLCICLTNSESILKVYEGIILHERNGIQDFKFLYLLKSITYRTFYRLQDSLKAV